MAKQKKAPKLSPSMTVLVRQTRSQIDCPQYQRDTLRALGLGRIGKSVTQKASPSIVGMLESVSHLIEIRQAK